VEIVYLRQALADLQYWKKSGNKAVQKKITQLIESIEKTPFKGIGKPEGLKYHHIGKWSRRITDEHRIIYEVENDKIYIWSLRGHYEKP
jgi:toxin YoeB